MRSGVATRWAVAARECAAGAPELTAFRSPSASTVYIEGVTRTPKIEVDMPTRRTASLLVVVLGFSLVLGCQAPSTSGTIQTAQVIELKAPSDPLHPGLCIRTNLGDIILELNAEDAPTTVLNFVAYAEGGAYDGTIFHRVVAEALLQGGAFFPDMSRKERTIPPTVPDDWHIETPSQEGTVALIRRTDREGVGNPQFFINLRDNVHHDLGHNHGRYAVFGKVVAGDDTIERIRNTPISVHPKYAAGLSPAVPTTPVVIEWIRLTTTLDSAKIMEVIEARNITPREAVLKRWGKVVADSLVETKSGLLYADLAEGGGPRTPDLVDSIEFQYRGTFLNGNEFESTMDTEPRVRTLSELIPGLQEAVGGMTEGGLRLAILPPELAYRDSGVPGIIPPNTTLVFEIELLEIK